MLKRIRMETSRKSGNKMVVIFGDDRQNQYGTDITILGSGSVRIVSSNDGPFIWIETTDQLIIDGEHWL